MNRSEIATKLLYKYYSHNPSMILNIECDLDYLRDWEPLEVVKIKELTKSLEKIIMDQERITLILNTLTKYETKLIELRFKDKLKTSTISQQENYTCDNLGNKYSCIYKKIALS